MTRLNGHAAQIRAEALALCGGIDDDRTKLAALAMHAHIINLSPDMFGWPPPDWHKGMARSAVKSADAVLAEIRKGATA